MPGPKGTIARGALEALTDAYKKTFDPETYYHTTPMGELEGGKFNPNFSLEDDGGLGATYFTKDKEYTNEVYEHWRLNDPDSYYSEITTYPVKIKTDEVFDYADNKSWKKLYEREMLSGETDYESFDDFMSAMGEDIKTGEWDFLENPEWQEYIKERGFRGYTTSEPGTVALFYPHKGDVRSIFAKFNPKESKSGNILASVPAAALATGALSELGGE